MGEGALSKAEMGAKIWRPPNTPPRFGVVAERSAESAGVKIFAHRMKINAVSQLRVHQTPPDRSQMGISGTELSARRATSETRRARATMPSSLADVCSERPRVRPTRHRQTQREHELSDIRIETCICGFGAHLNWQEP
jgi:hypothetical protein